MDLLSTSNNLTQWLFDWLNTLSVIFRKCVLHARRYVVWRMLKERTLYIASWRIALVMACQEVLPQVWPLMNQIRLFSIYNWNFTLHPSMCEDDHEWKDIIEIVCKWNNKKLFHRGKLPTKCLVGWDECSNKEQHYCNIFEWGDKCLFSYDIALGNSCVDVLKYSWGVKLQIETYHYQTTFWKGSRCGSSKIKFLMGKYCSRCFGIPIILGWISWCFHDYLEKQRIEKMLHVTCLIILW